MNDKDHFFNHVVSIYSQKQAIADGFLIDVSSDAFKSGFKIPVAVTIAVWEQYICWSEEDSDRQTGQDQSGRLADVLWMLFLACRINRDESEILFNLSVIPRDGMAQTPEKVTLKAIIGGGDAGEPVITIMLPNED